MNTNHNTKSVPLLLERTSLERLFVPQQTLRGFQISTLRGEVNEKHTHRDRYISGAFV
jgi:hypothetical protein